LNTRNSISGSAAVFLIVFLLSLPVYASPVYIYGGSFNLPIPSPADPNNSFGQGWMDDAIIEIADHHQILDLDVRISLTHTKVFDLQIFLQNPIGTEICLNMYHFDEYFDGENYTQTIFDDEAELAIEQAQPPFTGRFRPKAGNLLELFDDQDTYGSWRLRICDMWPTDTGSLNSFELTVTTPEPATAILLIFGAGLISLCKRRPSR